MDTDESSWRVLTALLPTEWQQMALRYGAVERFGGEVADGKGFVVRKSRSAQLLIRSIEDLLWIRVYARAAERGEGSQ